MRLLVDRCVRCEDYTVQPLKHCSRDTSGLNCSLWANLTGLFCFVFEGLVTKNFRP